MPFYCLIESMILPHVNIDWCRTRIIKLLVGFKPQLCRENHHIRPYHYCSIMVSISDRNIESQDYQIWSDMVWYGLIWCDELLKSWIVKSIIEKTWFQSPALEHHNEICVALHDGHLCFFWITMNLRCSISMIDIFTLNIQKTIENGHRNSWSTHSKWWIYFHNFPYSFVSTFTSG